MASKSLTVELPEELLDMFESPDSLSSVVREVLIADLLRDGRISQGKAAEILGITRWDVIDLMAKHHVESGPSNAEEMREDVDTVWRLLQATDR